MWGVTVGCHCRGSYQCVVLWLFQIATFHCLHNESVDEHSS